jgi:NitT/TauT family transport system substrate-binding protein
MLLLVLEKNGLTDEVEIVNQDVSTGLISIETQKIDAHATWEPYPAYMIHRGKSATLVDGSASGVDYLTGIVVDRAWAEANPELAVAVAQSLLQAHAFITQNPEEAARIFERESSFPIEVTQKLVSSVRWDAFVYPQDVETLKGDVTFLRSLGKIEEMDVNAFVDSSYLKQAAEKEGISYPSDKMLAQGWHETN